MLQRNGSGTLKKQEWCRSFYRLERGSLPTNFRAGASKVLGGKGGDKGPQPLLWAVSPAARVDITIRGLPNRLYYCVTFYSTYMI
jgi:hypothetical protein